ncbi:MAG: hypothetical protein COB76_02305 [Alphaproteobacteria bacterium]|nr:MAG: hypothetical protein COB76_02305 [Alphaproteobacteria bacterium]
MINQAGGAPQFPNNILQSGQQNAGIQQNSPDKRAQENKPQQNRAAEATAPQQSNESQNKNFQDIAESILAQRAENSDSQLTPAVERGVIVDITV